MSDHQQISSRENVLPQDAQLMLEQVVERRRKLIKGGLGAPVLMTLVSRRALGADTTCRTGSAFTSVNTSIHGQPTLCSGRSPEHWRKTLDPKASTSEYRPESISGGSSVAGANNSTIESRASRGTSLTSVEGTTLFHSSATGFRSGPFGSMGEKTLSQVLASDGGNTNVLARYISAALLNSRAGLTPVLDPTTVIMMWNDYVFKGYYEPTAGVKWNAAEIVIYLRHTQPL
jgi:hypothetical protein